MAGDHNDMAERGRLSIVLSDVRLSVMGGLGVDRLGKLTTLVLEVDEFTKFVGWEVE